MTRTYNEKLTAAEQFASFDKNTSKAYNSYSDWTGSEGNSAGVLVILSSGNMYQCSFSWFIKQKSNLLLNSFNSFFIYDVLW